MQKYLISILTMAWIAACMPTKTQEKVAEIEHTAPIVVDTQLQKGENLFKQHCSSCHAIEKKIVGPALGGIKQKYADDPKWLYAYIRNNIAMMKAGDPKAIALYEANGKAMMPTFTFLEDEEIAAILRYTDRVAQP